MKVSEELCKVLQSDVDDILDRAREYDSRTRSRMLRAAVMQYTKLKPLDRVKAVWFVQVMLASTKDRQLPLEISSDLATRLASIAESGQEERDARRSALSSLSLLFLKSKQLTDSLDATIRAAFMTAISSRDPYLRELATEVLSGEGVLAKRSPGQTTIFLSFSHPVDRKRFESVLRELRKIAAGSAPKSRRKVTQPAKTLLRKSHRGRDVSRPSHKNAG